MITPSDSLSAPALYAAVAVTGQNIQAAQEDLSAMAAAAVSLATGPRQAEARTLLESPQGFATQGYDIDSGYSGTWSNDVEPTVAGP